MAKVDVRRPFCQQTPSEKKHGLGSTGHQRYRCQDCCRSFQLDYEYRACQPGTKDKIIDLSPKQVTFLPLDNLHIEFLCEVDEQWSFVANKKQQRWLWYAWEPRLKRIIAHTFGRRNKRTLRHLLALLSRFNVAFWCTDKFSAYEILPKQKHMVSKFYTQRIERENLNLRNRLKRLNRKTLGYSKSPEMHDKIIGTLIGLEHHLLW